MAKTDEGNCKTYRACRHTVAGLLFVFVDHGAGIRRATYLCLDCAKNVDKNWNITVSFIIHVNFDHAWAEHYPATARTQSNEIGITVFVRILAMATINFSLAGVWLLIKGGSY